MSPGVDHIQSFRDAHVVQSLWTRAHINGSHTQLSEKSFSAVYAHRTNWLTLVSQYISFEWDKHGERCRIQNIDGVEQLWTGVVSAGHGCQFKFQPTQRF
eukprot:109614_1